MQSSWIEGKDMYGVTTDGYGEAPANAVRCPPLLVRPKAPFKSLFCREIF